MVDTSSEDPTSFDALGRALSMLVGAADVIEPHRLIELVNQCVAVLGGASASVWLVDHQMQILVHLSVADARESLPVDGTVAGRAFVTSEVVEVEHAGGTHLWVPLLSGVERVGVLEVVTSETAPNLAVLRSFAAVVTAELVASNQYTDHFMRTRRQKPLTLAAEMQRAALPPGSFATEGVQVAGMVQPAYEVGGDAFDYEHSDGLLSFAIFDAVGHTLESSVISSLALGTYRNARRNGRSLTETATAIDEVLRRQIGDGAFVTGQMVVLDTTDGTLSWLNAGHPLPLLIRQGRVIGHLECPPRPPFGLDGLARGQEPRIARVQLEPGDALLLYSDGVIERHPDGGADYGVERLEDFLTKAFADQMSPAETLRRLSNAVLTFHGDELQDDATTMLVVWRRPERG